MVELKISLAGELDKKLGLLDAALLKSIDKAIVKSAFTVQASAKTILQKGIRTGRLYKRGKITHRASDSGEPPKTDTGRLVNSMDIQNRFLEADIGSSLKYFPILEGGSKYMKPRPLLQPAFDQSKHKIESFIQQALKSVFK